MSDLQKQIENTKSVQELIDLFNKENDKILDDISNKKYSEVTQHLESFLFKFADAKEQKKITWDDPVKPSDDLKLSIIGFATKTKIAEGINAYALRKLINKTTEGLNFREAIIETITEHNKTTTKNVLETPMSEPIRRFMFSTAVKTRTANFSVPVDTDPEEKTYILPTSTAIKTRVMPRLIDDIPEDDSKLNSEPSLQKVKEMLDKIRNSGNDADKNNGPKNN
jgi:hypothetical protein